MPYVTTFRALSGSQYVYFTSDEPEPLGVTNKVAISTKFVSTVSQSNLARSNVLWEWNKTDTSQFIGEFEFLESDLGNIGGSGSLSVSTSSVDPSVTVLNVNYNSVGGSHVHLIDFDLSEYDQYALEVHMAGRGGSSPDFYSVFPIVGQSGSNIDAIAYAKSPSFTNANCFLYNNAEYRGSEGLPGTTAATTLIDNNGGLIVRCIVNKKPDANNRYFVKFFQVPFNGGDWTIEQVISSSIGGSWNMSGTNFNRCGIGVGEHGSAVTGFLQFQSIRILRVSSSLDVFI